MPVSFEIAVTPPSASMISGTVCMGSDYDNRNLDARGNTKTVIDRSLRISHARFMITPDQILREMHRWVADRRLLQKDIAAELGIAPARVNEMLKGSRRIQPNEMPILAKLFGMEEEEESNVRRIKRIGRVPAGSLRVALEETTDTVEVSAHLPKGVFALEVDGESMNNIAPLGADVIVDPNDKSLFSGDLYVIGASGGGFTFKRYLENPARLVPISSDLSHQEIRLGSEPITIIGRVVSVSIGAELLRRM